MEAVSLSGFDKPGLIFLMGGVSFFLVSRFLHHYASNLLQFIIKRMAECELKDELDEINEIYDSPNLSYAKKIHIIFKKYGQNYRNEKRITIDKLIVDKYKIDWSTGLASISVITLLSPIMIFVYLFLQNTVDDYTRIMNDDMLRNSYASYIFFRMIFDPILISAAVYFLSFMHAAMAVYKYLTYSVLAKSFASQDISFLARSPRAGLVGAGVSAISVVGSVASIVGLTLYLMERAPQ